MTTTMEPSAKSAMQMRAGDLLLDPVRQSVTVAGRTVELPRLPFQLLEALMRAAPRLVSAEELSDGIRQKDSLSRETVQRELEFVRQAIGDDAQHPRFIGVVSGKGYGMLVPVEHLQPDEASLASNLFSELGRRRVVQVALLYAAAAWSITEILSFIVDAIPVFPQWTKPLIAILFVVGFPVAMFLAWRFDVGPEGIQRTQAASRSGRLAIASAIALLVGATVTLFYLVYPSVVDTANAPLAPPVFEIAENSIAVLPFSNDSGDPANNYISEGFSDALRTQLGQVPDLQVVAPTSSRMFKGELISIVEIAQQLRVSTLVEGQLYKQGDELRVNVQIINGLTGFQLWAHSFERRSRDLLAVQRDIAGQVVKQLVPDIPSPFEVTEPFTMVPNAYELLLIANDYFNLVRSEAIVDVGKLERAINYYRLATDADPNSAVAFSRLGVALAYAGNISEAGDAIRRALEINPDISEVQYTLGVYSWRTYLSGTGNAYKRAIELNPNNVDALEAYAKWIWHQKIYDKPEAYFLKALELDRAALNRWADLGNYYGMSGMHDKAIDIAERIATEFEGSSAYLVVARLFELVGQLDVAIGWALRAHESAPDDDESDWMLAELYARLGDFETARSFEGSPAFNLYFWERRYEDMIDLGGDLVIDHPEQIQIWYGLARAYLATGQFELTVHVLEQRGIPENALSENRRANDQEALIMYADALNQLDREAEAREHALWMDKKLQLMRETGGDKAWWGHLYTACVKSILAEHDAALNHLENMVESTGMPWVPVLRDAPCFQKYQNLPRYVAVVDAIEDQKRRLRARLPNTLALTFEVD